MKIELDLQSPYNPDGTPREDLPTGEVLAWDGKDWANGILGLRKDNRIILWDTFVVDILLLNVLRFAPLPTIIEENDLL
jgi:hypothetical protein